MEFVSRYEIFHLRKRLMISGEDSKSLRKERLDHYIEMNVASFAQFWGAASCGLIICLFMGLVIVLQLSGVAVAADADDVLMATAIERIKECESV